MVDNTALTGRAVMGENSVQPAFGDRSSSQLARKDEYIVNNLSTRALFVKLGQEGPGLFDRYDCYDMEDSARADWGTIWDSLDFGLSPLIDPEIPYDQQ